eukprot:COSAG06_NODE_1352_length_9757_cov_3.878236_7_plen_79_part_00
MMRFSQAEYNIAQDPTMRGIGGSSSGAIAAFMVAWERPEMFHKVRKRPAFSTVNVDKRSFTKTGSGQVSWKKTGKNGW